MDKDAGETLSVPRSIPSQAIQRAADGYRSDVYKIQMGDDVVMCCVFVDDAVFYSTSTMRLSILSAFREQFGDDGITGGALADGVLGLTVEYDDERLTCSLGMSGYIRKICERFGINDKSYLPKTPLPTTHEDKKYEGPLDKDRQRLFQQMVGCMTWCSHQAKPEAMISTSILSQHCHIPRLAREHCRREIHQ